MALQKIQRQVRGCSDAELKMGRELRDLQRRTRDLTNALEQLRMKERYQLRQAEEARQTQAAAAQGRHWPFGSPSSPLRSAAAAANSDMDENQLKSVKEVLEQDSKQIADIVKAVNNIKRDLAV